MAKGSVRKKGKKWYYRFYVEDASGKMVQKEYVGTESKSETEKLLRKALEDYEDKKFVAKADNLTVGELLDMWAEEELKTGTLSNGTVENYLGAIRCIKKTPDCRPQVENSYRRTFTGISRPAYLRWRVSRRESEKRIQQRLYPFFFRSVTAVIPFCSISKTVNQFQSNAVY